MEAGISTSPSDSEVGISNASDTHALSDAVHAEGSQGSKLNSACAACREKKIKCSGSRPSCDTCTKLGRLCVYPPRASRKKRRRFERSVPIRRDVGDGTSRAELVASHNAVIQQPSRSTLRPSQSSSPSLSSQISGQSALAFGNAACSITETSQGQVTADTGEPLGYWNDSGSSASQDYVLPHSTTVFSPNDGLVATSQTRTADPGTEDVSLSTDDLDVRPLAVASNGMQKLVSMSQMTERPAVPFFRFFGPTAIAPGYNKVSSIMSRAPSPRSNVLQDLTPSTPAVFSAQPLDDYPSLQAVEHLLPLFYCHFSYFFPFIRIALPPTTDVLTSTPAVLLNSICAVAARFSPFFETDLTLYDDESLHDASTRWAAKAKSLIIRDLAFSTLHMVEALMLMSWYEFGGDRDGGLWMYSGMALRMARDLGLDTLGAPEAQSVSNDDHAMDLRRMHCSLRMMDAIMSIAGRAGMFQNQRWIVPQFPDLTVRDGSKIPDLYQYLARIFVYVDSIAGILADAHFREPSLALTGLQGELSDFYTSLPSALKFGTSTFIMYAKIDQGAGFVLLHLWFHALILLVYRPFPLLFDKLTGQINLDEAGPEVAASSAKSILDIVAFAEIIDQKAVAQPWINYPLYLAARMFLSQSKSPSEIGLPSSGRSHMVNTAKQDFDRVMQMLGTVESSWKGVRYIRSALIQISGEGASTASEDHASEPNAPFDQATSDFLAMLEQTQDVSIENLLGFGLSGTIDTPAEHRFGLLLPRHIAATNDLPKGFGGDFTADATYL